MRTGTLPTTPRRRPGPTRGRLGIVLLAAVATLTCSDPKGLTSIGPNDPSISDPAIAQQVKQKWSPYVAVHVTGEALTAYQDALTRLIHSGQLKGVRLEIDRNSLASGDRVIRTVGALGVELLGLISNELLFDANVEGTIDRIFSSYPEIRYFQVGNEITTILPSSGPTMTIEEYMVVFQRIYNHVQLRYPGRATLLTQSTLGAGLYGPEELERMANLGLARMDPARVIVAINDYDPYQAGNYVGLLGNALRPFRVWITESGVSNADHHISFVQDGYPLLRNYLRAERIYWYVLWGGDSGSDTEFSLIRNPASYPNYWTSPLFTMLTQR